MTDAAAHIGRGLRSRLIIGFVAVVVSTALITGVATVVATFIFMGNRGSVVYTYGQRTLVFLHLANAQSGATIWFVLVGGGVLLVLAVGAASLVAQRVLTPLSDLAEAAERVAAGDLTVRLVPTGKDELADLVNTFNKMTQNLAASIQELQRLEAHARRFASDVSHELRSPLAAMTAVTDLLSSETVEMSDRTARATRLVVQEIGHLDRLVNDLIEMSRFAAGSVVLDREVVHLNAAVTSCLHLRGWTDRVTVHVPASLDASLDRRRFDVMVANLVGNATKYGRPPITITGHEILLEAVRWLELTVEDSGPGIAPAALPHLFERFYKADQARARSDGSGLGLAIALENARLHGGTLSAANRPSGGAKFTLRIPLSPP